MVSNLSLLFLLSFTLANAVITSGHIEVSSWPWTWECKENRCVKQLFTNSTSVQQSPNSCRLICGQYRTLWPIPKEVTLSQTVVQFLPQNIEFVFTAPDESIRTLLTDAGKIFSTYLQQTHPKYAAGRVERPFSAFSAMGGYSEVPLSTAIKIEVAVLTSESNLTLETDESYSLNITSSQSSNGDKSSIYAKIVADNFYGARHGLETLSQLIEYHEFTGSLQILSGASISDSPSYKYRGVLIDTSRNYFSVASLQRIIDAMSHNKLNALHWHITDTHSFPLKTEKLPELAKYGAYTPDKIYDRSSISSLIEYARVRGVRIIPELDAPAHSGNGWQFGEKAGLGPLAVCINKEPWAQFCVEPPCGQLNVVNDNLYTVLDTLYSEMLDYFKPDMFHMGGDEVNLNCWNTSSEITDWMKLNGMAARTEANLMELWGRFQNKTEQLVFKHNGKQLPIILWTSHLTDKAYIDKYLNTSIHIIQIWTKKDDAAIGELLKRGYRLILSNYDALYFDCGFGAWVGEGNNWCSPYIGWQIVYNNNPDEILKTHSPNPSTYADKRHLILGSEAALWTEQADEQCVDSRLWPRGAAMAERLWSNPESTWQEAEPRMLMQRQRMVQRGVAADTMQPEWCFQNPGLCYA